MAGFHPAVDEPLPDAGQLLEPGPEQVDPLAAGDLRVEPVVLGDPADEHELLGEDLTARHPRDDGVRPVLLQVRQVPVVRVLQGRTVATEHVLVVQGGDDRRDDRLADVAAAA